jgi:D-alanyl-D-alanine dipeptidase
MFSACAAEPTPPPVAPVASAAPFRIQPVRPIEDIRREAIAAKPPEEADRLPSDLVEVQPLEPTIRLDIRYATTNNLLGTKVYDEPRAFLQRPAAEALIRVHRALAKQGYGVLIHDGYRPWYVTKIFWDATPDDKHEFVANPARGSRHNRGCAVDLTLFELGTGKVVEMPSTYDELSERAHADYPGGTAEQRRTRGVLRAAMEAEGFAVYDVEWWHFDYKDWKLYPLGNVMFDKIGK